MRTFDHIVAIGRGGCIVAAYLASKLGIPVFCPVFVSHTERAGKTTMIEHDLCTVKSLKGRLLLVDDWLCDGIAMNYVIDLLPKDTTVTTLVMFNRRTSAFKPDIVASHVEAQERKLIFPYDPAG
jgi:hypoxanthine phosphoribosyltransferase